MILRLLCRSTDELAWRSSDGILSSEDFVAAVSDIGGALSRHLDTHLTLKALRIALANRTVPPGLVHHSDRGVQYAAADYVALLQEHQIKISISRTGNPYDNAKAERFMRTLKYEEVYLCRRSRESVEIWTAPVLGNSR
jgi:transposase InsO family protein